MIQIFFIYADECEHCQAALSTIENAMIQCKEIPCEIIKFKYDTPAAVKIAINKSIDDLPGFVIGDSAFMGNNYSLEKIVEAIRKTLGSKAKT